MSVLFSKVKFNSQDDCTEFLCKGNPRAEKDLYNWAAYEEFRNSHRGEEILAVIEAYTYGDGVNHVCFTEEKVIKTANCNNQTIAP